MVNGPRRYRPLDTSASRESTIGDMFAKPGVKPLATRSVQIDAALTYDVRVTAGDVNVIRQAG